jgi:hypothetical protein
MIACLAAPIEAQVFGTMGPLRRLATNPRYFTDGSGRAVYLTGSHNWVNFKDYGTTDPPPAMDYALFLTFLQGFAQR